MQTASGNVEAKVMCFYRRRDISPPLLAVADRHQGTRLHASPHYIAPLVRERGHCSQCARLMGDLS